MAISQRLSKMKSSPAGARTTRVNNSFCDSIYYKTVGTHFNSFFFKARDFSFPDNKKMAKVVPIYKSGNIGCFLNYRPVFNILPCFPKILERIMFNRIQTALNKHNILFKEQYGFRPGPSIELTRICIDKITEASGTDLYKTSF